MLGHVCKKKSTIVLLINPGKKGKNKRAYPTFHLLLKSHSFSKFPKRDEPSPSKINLNPTSL